MSTTEEITDPRVIKALGHPLRMRILGLLDGRTASPKELAEELGQPLGNVSYHVRTLADLGFIELVRKKPRRGAIEHFYRAESKHILTDTDWAHLPSPAKRSLTQKAVAQVGKDVQAAIASGGFDVPEARVTRSEQRLDDQACKDLAQALSAFLERAAAIEKESRARLGKAKDTDGHTHAMVSVAMMFRAGERPKA